MPRTLRSRSLGSVIPAIIVIIGLIVLGVIIAFLTKGTDVALLNPKGYVAHEQYKLLVHSTLVMLVFAVPVALAIYFFAWRYREDNQKSIYNPNTKEHKAYLLFAWGGPLAVVIVLAALMLPATQQLAHQQPIESSNDPITVQVVALNWKWLFIYPDHDVASLNYVQIPVDTPVRFELTADGAPMSSFWIPHLGGMLYVMTGHVNPVNLISDTIGDYPGSSAEINGHGYAHMKFTTRVSSQSDFDNWIADKQQSGVALSDSEYEKLKVPSEGDKPAYFKGPDADFFSDIVSKYAGSHGHGGDHEHGGY